MGERNESVDRLLHDAEHAHNGAGMAAMMRDAKAERELYEKRDRLVREALALDPKREAPAWDDADCEWLTDFLADEATP